VEIIGIVYECIECSGVGTITHNSSPGGPIVTDTCPKCGGDGKVVSDTQGLLKSYFDANQLALINELDYIHGKVTAIWNKVK